jgi:hypothetical protein
MGESTPLHLGVPSLDRLGMEFKPPVEISESPDRAGDRLDPGVGRVACFTRRVKLGCQGSRPPASESTDDAALQAEEPGDPLGQAGRQPHGPAEGPPHR